MSLPPFTPSQLASWPTTGLGSHGCALPQQMASPSSKQPVTGQLGCENRWTSESLLQWGLQAGPPLPRRRRLCGRSDAAGSG